MSELTQWEDSCREKALQALEKVLGAIPGVRYVNRQAITPELVSDQQLPAIIVEEVRTQYRWTNRARREAVLSSILVLDLQVQSSRLEKASGMNTSSIREAFVEQVMKTLAGSATLNAQLEGEANAQDHARDVAGTLADVQYPAAPPPKARALVTIRVDIDTTYDSRTRTAWERLVLDLYALDEVGEEDSYEPAITLDVTATP